jgi:LPS sulfotransferase NodH
MTTTVEWGKYVSDVSLYPDKSHHRDAIEAHFRIDPQSVHEPLLELTRVKTVVFVCFSNRSGSNLLLDALGRIGFGCEAGDEFFNASAISDHVQEFMFETFEQYLEFLVKMRGFRDCVFFKIGPHQLFWMANSGLLGKYFANARYVLIERADRVAQSVSLYIADKTGAYVRPSGDSDPIARDIEYSKHGILRSLKHVVDVGCLFRYFFDLHSVRYHLMRYEDLDADPVRTVAAMSNGLEIERYFPQHWERALRKQPAGIARQSNELNAAFVARFKKDFAIRSDDDSSNETPL